MALMTEHTARSSLVVGIIELVFGVIAVICGIVSVSKLSSPAATTIGMWAFYFAIPGILCILAGVKKESNMMGGALAANIIGIIVAAVAFIIGAVFWALINSFTCGDSRYTDHCVCADLSNRFNLRTDDITIYSSSCSDLTTVRNATAVVTFVYAILGIVCFIGSIYGCAVTCCAPNAPTVIVTSTVPQPNTIVVTNQTSQGQPMAYVQGQPMAYAQGQPMAYPQGQQMAYPQGQPIAYGHGQPMAYGQAAYPGTAQQQPPAYPDSQINAGVQYVGKQ